MPQPVDIKIRTESRILDVSFDDGTRYELPFGYQKPLLNHGPAAMIAGG